MQGRDNFPPGEILPAAADFKVFSLAVELINQEFGFSLLGFRLPGSVGEVDGVLDPIAPIPGFVRYGHVNYPSYGFEWSVDQYKASFLEKYPAERSHLFSGPDHPADNGKISSLLVQVYGK